MDIVIMQVFVSLLLVVGAVLLLAYSVKQADHEHADRLALLPMEDDGRRDPSSYPVLQTTSVAPAPSVSDEKGN